MAIQPGAEVLDYLAQARAAADYALDLVDQGTRAESAETEWVDFKEEAGRRDRAGQVLLGQARSQAVAEQLANEVACLANSPQGGALIVGIADDGTRVSAASDRDWLRQRIRQRVDLAPVIEERFLSDGTRVLVLLVAAAREPVEDTRGRIRWRVGTSCAPVDRAQWWADRLARQGGDPLFGHTTRKLTDLAPGALVAFRRLLRDQDRAQLRELPDRELLSRLGVLLPSGQLTAAGVHFFCPAPRTVIEFLVMDVPGGNVISDVQDLAQLSLIEQLTEVEIRIDAVNTGTVFATGPRLAAVPQIPGAAIRESLLNAIVHRDWFPTESITAIWFQLDSRLDISSPGGFVGGINQQNVLSARYSRNPALADLARAMGLVEKQGVGVDRMYREMVVLGHPPPTIREEFGPRVRTTLLGGRPLEAAQLVVTHLLPVARRQDFRVPLVLYVFMRDGFATPQSVAEFMQISKEEAIDALQAAGTCRISRSPVVVEDSPGLWVFEAARDLLAAHPAAIAEAKERRLLTWLQPDRPGLHRFITTWLGTQPEIRSDDVARLCSLNHADAGRLLGELVSAGLIQCGPAGQGRTTHYTPGPTFSGGGR
ncbi:MAG: DUF5635 domain-containing protein [Angustibacter sp.]